MRPCQPRDPAEKTAATPPPLRVGQARCRHRFGLRPFRPVLFLFLLLLALPAPAAAAAVELPLFLRARILENALQEAVAPGPERKAILYQKDAYNYFHIADPRLTLTGGAPLFRCNIAAGAGFESLGVLPSTVHWSGYIMMNLDFFVDDQWRLRYRIRDSAIYDEKGAQAVLTSFVWNLSRRFLYPLLEKFSFDLSLPQQEIIALLRTSVSAQELALLEATLKTVTVGTLRGDESGIVVPLVLTVPDPPLPANLPPEQPLTLEEMEGLQQLLEPLDAFLVFVVKSAGADLADPQLRNQLFDLLITSRYKLLSILAGETPVDAGDPLRALFVDVWQQLHAIIETCSEQVGTGQEQLLRYMTFINAGDALLALDKAAPQLGMHITTDGLRRLARMLQPTSKDDPLRFDWEVDPALRKLLNFAPEPKSPPAEPPLGSRLLELLVSTAHAEETVPLTLAEVKKKLDRWVPSGAELDDYAFLIAQLLRNAAVAQGKGVELPPEYVRIFQALVPATALIESCWRQFEESGGKVSCVRSKSGSLGMMQINPHVWRGFYDIDKLKWDVYYNIQAGAQILMRYYREEGIRVAQKSGKPDHAVRAAYSAYNAGPQAARRFLKSGSAREKEVDDRLWRFYRGFAAGGAVNLETCSVGSDGA